MFINDCSSLFTLTLGFEVIIGIAHKQYCKSIAHWDAAAERVGVKQRHCIWSSVLWSEKLCIWTLLLSMEDKIRGNVSGRTRTISSVWCSEDQNAQRLHFILLQHLAYIYESDFILNAPSSVSSNRPVRKWNEYESTEEEYFGITL